LSGGPLEDGPSRCLADTGIPLERGYREVQGKPCMAQRRADVTMRP
jgi:hypothetical protein